jgi:hypothetical protein
VIDPPERGIEFFRQRILFFNYDMGSLTVDLMRHAARKNLKLVIGDRVQEDILVVREQVLRSIETTRPPMRFEPLVSRYGLDMTSSSAEEARLVAESLQMATGRPALGRPAVEREFDRANVK